MLCGMFAKDCMNQARVLLQLSRQAYMTGVLMDCQQPTRCTAVHANTAAGKQEGNVMHPQIA